MAHPFRGNALLVPGLLVRILSKQTLSRPLPAPAVKVRSGAGAARPDPDQVRPPAPGRPALPPHRRGRAVAGAAGSGRDGDERRDGGLDGATRRLEGDAEDVTREHA